MLLQLRKLVLWLGSTRKLFVGGVITFTKAKVNSLTQLKGNITAHMYWMMKTAGKKH